MKMDERVVLRGYPRLFVRRGQEIQALGAVCSDYGSARRERSGAGARPKGLVNQTRRVRTWTRDADIHRRRASHLGVGLWAH